MVVVAEAQASVGAAGRHLVEFGGDRGDACSVSEPGRRQVRDDDGVGAQRLRRGQDVSCLLACRVRVHAAHLQASRIQVGAQAVWIIEHVHRLDGAVTGGGNPLEDACPVSRKLLADGVQLQRRGVTGQHGSGISRTDGEALSNGQ